MSSRFREPSWLRSGQVAPSSAPSVGRRTADNIMLIDELTMDSSSGSRAPRAACYRVGTSTVKTFG